MKSLIKILVFSVKLIFCLFFNYFVRNLEVLVWGKVNTLLHTFKYLPDGVLLPACPSFIQRNSRGRKWRQNVQIAATRAEVRILLLRISNPLFPTKRVDMWIILRRKIDWQSAEVEISLKGNKYFIENSILSHAKYFK